MNMIKVKVIIAITLVTFAAGICAFLAHKYLNITGQHHNHCSCVCND